MKRFALLVKTAAVMAFAGVVSAQEFVVDNGDPGFTNLGGGWFSSANQGFFGSNSLITQVGTGTDRVRWAQALPSGGDWEVYAWWVGSSNRTTAAPYQVQAFSGLQTVLANQTTNSGQWNSLGTFPFAAGTATVELSNDAPAGSGITYVSADAIRFVYRGGGTLPDPCANPITGDTFTTLGAAGNCAGLRLPGALVAHPSTRYSIHSDLPEKFDSDGVLYTTAAVLPEDTTGDPIPLSLRTQTNNGFTTIDDDFDVFLFHISQPGNGSAPRRIVIYARNEGTESVTIAPRQVIRTSGTIGTIHEMESTLGRRWMEGNFDARPESVTIAPGSGEVVGYSNNFAGFGAGIDSNINCFGLLRADVIDANSETNLVVSVVAIPSGQVANIKSSTESLLNVAANSDENSINLKTAPGPSELRRAVGVFENFLWQSDLVTIETNALSAGGVSFPMALSRIQAGACPTGRQTNDMLLHPGFAHGDTTGNYHVDYRVDFQVVNNDSVNPRAVDILFGKSGADVGLGWQATITRVPLTNEELFASPVYTGWAGPNQAAPERTFLEAFDGRVTLRPCEKAIVSLRFQVLGNSSLPFTLKVIPTAAGEPTLPPESNVPHDLWHIE